VVIQMTNQPTTQTDNRYDNQRHEWISDTCELLEKIVWGGQAAEILNSTGGTIPSYGSCQVLPVWAWREPKIDMGRKAQFIASAGTKLMPIRVTRTEGHIALVPSGRTEEMPWRAKGLGHDLSGHTTVTCTPLADETRDNVPDLSNNQIHVPAFSRETVTSMLKSIVSDGTSARWDLTFRLERYVRRSVNQANSYVAHELAADASTTLKVLSEQDVEQIVTTLLIGDVNEEAKPNTISRLIDRCLVETVFQKVDPLRYIVRALRRDAEQQIRIHIGDPRVGPKVRAIQRQFKDASIDEIVDIYRARHPKDRLGRKRAIESLATPKLIIRRHLPDRSHDSE